MQNTVLNISKLKKLTATAPFYIYFAVFKNVVHSLEPGETPSYSKLCTTFLNIEI